MTYIVVVCSTSASRNAGLCYVCMTSAPESDEQSVHVARATRLESQTRLQASTNMVTLILMADFAKEPI